LRSIPIRRSTARTSRASQPAVAGTTAPAGTDHPEVKGLTGVAPRAWLGNYRVFTVPTPLGHVANTPEIIEAFEAAVRDGMDVINFSGGGPQIDPANDALIEAIHNVAATGVVPVIAAGNDGDDFGLGSAGSPGTAPDAISVAAVSNTHVFAPALDVAVPGAPDVLQGIPFLGANGSPAPSDWGAASQTLVDVGSVVGRDGRPVERHLCGPAGNLASSGGQLPAGSFKGAIALVERGLCPFTTKAEQAKAAGAIGLIVSDNRAGEANGIPAKLELPGGMIADLDGDHLRAFLATSGGPNVDPDRPRSARARNRAQRHHHEFLVPRADSVSATISSPTSQRPAARSSRRRFRTPVTRASRCSTAPRWRRRTSRAPPRSCSSCIRAGRLRR